MRFLDVKRGAYFCFLNGLGIAVPVLETSNSVNNYIIIAPDYSLPNVTKVSNYMN